MSRRPASLLLLCAATLSACPAPTTAPVGLAAKQQKVDQLTGAFSIQGNAQLKLAAEDVGAVNTSLAAPGYRRAEGAMGNLVAQGGGNLVATGAGNLVAQGGGNIISTGGAGIISTGAAGLGPRLADLARAVAAFGVPPRRLAQAADVNVEFDPKTGELLRLHDANASLRFKYGASGSRHTELVTLGGMANGTTGSLLIDITSAGWRSTTPPPQYSFDPYADEADQGDASYDPTQDPTYQDPYAGYGGYAGYPAYPYPSYPGYGLRQAAGITFMGNEAPTSPQRVAVGLKLVPRGVAADALAAHIAVDEVKLWEGQPFGTHLVLDASVPSLAFDGDLHFTDQLGSYAAKGGVKLATKAGLTESFAYSIGLDYARRQGQCQIDHAASQVSFRVAVQYAPDGRTSQAMGLYDMQTNAKLADVTEVPADQWTLQIAYVDGTTKRWAPFSGLPATTLATPTPAPTGRPSYAPVF